MNKKNPEKFKTNEKTGLAPGDLHRTAAIFLLLGVLAVIGAFLIFPSYEADWGEYYIETYGGTNPMGAIFTAIKVMAALYIVIGVTLKVIGRKIDPKPAGSGIW